MKTKMLFSILTLCSAMLFAQNPQPVPPSMDMNQKIAEMLNTGAPESAFNYNADGSVKSILIYVEVPLRKGLPAAYAKKYGANDARIAANKKFATMLSNSVEISETADGEIITRVKGSSVGEGNGTSASESEIVNRNSETYKNFSKAAISGLAVSASNANKDGMYCAVYSWSAKRTASLMGVSKKMAKTAASAASDAAAVDIAKHVANKDVLNMAVNGTENDTNAAAANGGASASASGSANAAVKGGNRLPTFGNEDL